MKILMPFYYQEFQCIGDRCPDTCCKEWEITVDKETWEKYQTLEGTLGEKLRSSISIDNGIFFKLEKDKRCPLLSNKNLCEVVLQKGEEFLCTTCGTYPRFSRLNGDVVEYGLSLSCPEVARILLSIKEPIDFFFFDDGKEIPVNPKIDYSLYNDLLTARRISMDIAQNRSLEIWERLFVLCLFNQKVQNIVLDNRSLDRHKFFCQYDNPEYVKEMVREVQKIDFSQEKQFKSRLDWAACFWNNLPKSFEEYKNLFKRHTENKAEQEIIREYEKASQEFSQYYRGRACEYENLIVYWLFRYYMQSAEDKYLYKNVAMLVLAYVVMRFFAVYQWLNSEKELTLQEQGQIFYKYSRAVEHSQKSYNNLYHALAEEGLNTVGYLLFLCREI